MIKEKNKDLLKKYDIKPKKRLGQNFIFDENILNKIAQLIEPIDNFSIVEIGPGPGGLTRLLERSPKSFILIEKDISFKGLLDLVKEYPQASTLGGYSQIF